MQRSTQSLNLNFFRAVVEAEPDLAGIDRLCSCGKFLGIYCQMLTERPTNRLHAILVY